MINFEHNGVDYSAENSKCLLNAMKDLKIDVVNVTYTFMGQDALKAKLSLRDVEKLVSEAEATQGMTDREFFEHYSKD
jgi:hypothetical protein